MNLSNRKDLLYVILAGFFITNAIIAELIGAKLIQLGPFAMSIGVIPWPIVFISTDIINEHFGKDGVKRLTFITMGLIAYAFVIIFLAMQVPSASFSPVTSQQFEIVFGQSLWIIFGSIVAFMVSQFVDVTAFIFFKNLTQGRFLWLRATGSTAISQLFDSLIIIGVAFWLPGKIKTSEFLAVAVSNYSYKFIIAILTTPFIYLAHAGISRFLKGENTGDRIKDSDL